MSNEFKPCEVCWSYQTELHHIVFKSQNKQLEDCKLNHIYLCPKHHRGTYGVHGSKGHNLDKNLKLKFQKKLDLLLFKEYLTREDIKEVLDIKDKPLDKLLKTIRTKEGKYTKEDIIRRMMGDRLVLGECGNK